LRRASRAAAARSGSPILLDEGEPERQRLHLIVIESQRRQRHRPAHHIADAGLPFDREPVRLQRGDVAIDGAHRYFERFGQILRPREAPALQPIDERD
jgi:hypothetical protein